MSKGKSSAKGGKVKEQVSFFDMEEEPTAKKASAKTKEKAPEKTSAKASAKTEKAEKSAKSTESKVAPKAAPKAAPKVAAKEQDVAPRKSSEEKPSAAPVKAAKVASAAELAPATEPTNGSGHAESPGEAEAAAVDDSLQELGMDAKGAWRILPDGTRESLDLKEWRAELAKRYKRTTAGND